jgi:hypothetical protein
MCFAFKNKGYIGFWNVFLDENKLKLKFKNKKLKP